MTFFDKYSYKQKNYALLILTVLLVTASYKRAFSITIDTIKNKNELSEKLEDSHLAVAQIKQTQQQIGMLNRYLGRENITIEKVQQGFLNFFNRHSTNIAVYQIDEVHRFQHPDFAINTHKIILKGGFIPTLKFLYKFEKEFDMAKLANVKMEYKKFNYEEKEQLYTTILLQNYER